MCSFLSTLAPLVIVMRVILSCTLPFTTGSLHMGLNFSCLCGSCQGAIHAGVFLTLSKASTRDPSCLWTPQVQWENQQVHLVAFHGHMATWPDRSGCRHHPSLSLAACTGDTSHHSTSGTAFYDFLHQCWLKHFSSISLGFPVSSWRKTPLETYWNHWISASCSRRISFSMQHEQNLGDIAHNTETSFKFLK